MSSSEETSCTSFDPFAPRPLMSAERGLPKYPGGSQFLGMKGRAIMYSVKPLVMAACRRVLFWTMPARRRCSCSSGASGSKTTTYMLDIYLRNESPYNILSAIWSMMCAVRHTKELQSLIVMIHQGGIGREGLQEKPIVYSTLERHRVQRLLEQHVIYASHNGRNAKARPQVSEIQLERRPYDRKMALYLAGRGYMRVSSGMQSWMTN